MTEQQNAETATAARLLELLDLKDAQLQEREQEATDLRRQLEFGIDWMLHSVCDQGETLPVPRVQLRLVSNYEHHCESAVELVLEANTGRRSRIPVEYGKRSGGGVDTSLWPDEGDVPEKLSWTRHLPSTINDACFYAEKTGFPLFVVLDDSRSYKATSLRPLKLTAVT